MRMKSIILSMLSVMALVSCNKEGMPDNEMEGVPTYATFNVRMTNASTTKASTPNDGNAVDVEQKVNTVSIYIFQGQVLNAFGDITLGLDNKGTTAVATTTGRKKIYAVLNNKGTAPTLTIGTSTIDDLKAALTYDYNADVADGSGSGNFVMMGEVESVLVEHKSESAAVANPISINVDRASAKVSLIYDKTKVKHTALKGTIDDEVKYSLMQTHKKVGFLRSLKDDTGINYTPTDPTTHVDTDGGANGDGIYDHLNKYFPTTGSATYKSAQAAIADAKEFANSDYCAENINATPTTGNVTFAVVRLQYTPHASEFKGATKSPETDGSFYVVTSAAGLKNIYGTAAEAEGDADYNATTNPVVKHDKGYCYYRLNIRDLRETAPTKRYALLRNHFYCIDIQNVNSVGDGSEDALIPSDPDTPLETTTYMTADITINVWNKVTMDEDLD